MEISADYRDETDGPHKCVSVGWMIRDDNNLKVLASNFGGVDNVIDPERTLQACGVIRIPTCSVVLIKRLNEQGEEQLFPRSDHDSDNC